MLGTVYYKGIAGISSMQGMTREFNNETVAGNLYSFMGSKEKEYLPHGVTVNEFLERLDPLELEEIQSDIVYKMIRRKTVATIASTHIGRAIRSVRFLGRPPSAC